MEPKNLLSLQNQQKFQLSLAMRQSLDVLQMPIDDLAFWVEEQIEKNPLLEWTPSSSRGKNLSLDIEIPYQPSLFEHLMTQAREQIEDSLSLQQMEWIIGNLEETGFFTQSLETLPEGWNRRDLEALLNLLHQFDPPGIGASNVQESLLLQLKSLGKEDSLSYILIQNYLEELLQGKLAFIQKKCCVDQNTLHHAIYSEIAALDPFPGIRFQKEVTQFITPDVFFLEENDLWQVQINEEKLPSFSILKTPQNLFLTKEDKLFCKEHIAQGKQLHSMIEKRRATLYKVTKYLAEIQISYLKEESSSLKPLTITEVAEKLEMHESTITRTVNHKYLSCRWGTIALKSLLSHHLSEHISSDQAQKLLLKLVAEESKKEPLSDRELLEKMRKTGIPCSRRTVTNYRNSLQIPSRRFRKKLKSS